MPRTTRETVITNVYKDNHGYEIIVRRNGVPDRKRLHKDTSRTKLKETRDQMIEDLIVKVAKTAPGTLAGDVQTYLKTIPEGRSRDRRADDLAPWVKIWGPVKRDQITVQMVRETLTVWHATKRASTLNHYRKALRGLYKTLDGPNAPTPCDHVPKFRETIDIRAVPRACVLAILRRVAVTKTGARIKVIARTGLPHAQIARLKPSDLDLPRREVHVTPRRKGAGTTAKTLPLTHAAVRAFRVFVRLGAWGEFSRHSLRHAFHRAVQRAIGRWPKEKGPWPAPTNLRPYDLRHAFLSEVYRRTRDLRATAELGLHASLTTTARYADSAVTDTAAAARDAMDRKSAIPSAKKHGQRHPLPDRNRKRKRR